MQGYFYEMLYGVMNAALEDTISTYNLPAWPQDEKRNRFLLHAMDAYTGLTEYPAPMLLQLESFTEVRSSGLQMTRSPGAFLVYLGSVLLVLGTVFMFYIREKRAWLLFSAAVSVLPCLPAATNATCRKNFRNTHGNCSSLPRI